MDSVPGGRSSLIVMFGLVAGVFQILESEARVWRAKAAEAGQSFMSGVEGLFGGFVELKMNQARREDYVQRRVLEPCAEASRQQREYEYIHMKGNCLYAVLNYLPAGIIAFVVPFYLDIATADLLKLIGVALFATPALVNLAMFEPLTSKAFDTVKSIERLDEELSRKGENIAFEAGQKAPLFLDRLIIDDLRFSYPPPPGGDGRERFSLKIDHFELKMGELVIIHGGNGNGKSTFFRLLAGLNTPDQGRISVDGRDLPQIGLNNYRALFSTVFADFFLFDSLFGLKAEAEDVKKAFELVKLGPDVVQVLEDGRFSTPPQDLSSGQRKRLALACAMLEKRPVALFDEVAADFDPGFRRAFYNEILPSLKSPERAILAISHDDRFFGVADRIFKMEFNPQTNLAELIEEDAAQWRTSK